MLPLAYVWGLGHGHPSSTPGKREGEPSGRKGKTSSAPTPGLCLSQAPRWRGIAGVRGGDSLSRKQKSCQASPTKKKHQKSGVLAPPTPAPSTKSAKHYHKKGVNLEGPLA